MNQGKRIREDSAGRTEHDTTTEDVLFRRLQRLFPKILLGSVSLAAVLGAIIVLENRWGWFEPRVMLTTIIVAVASVFGLATHQARTPRGANVLPTAGLVLTLVASAMILIGIWLDIDPIAFWQVTAIVTVFAVATVHICLLSIARLADRFQWVFLVAYQVIYGLAVLLAAVILRYDTRPMLRFVAVLAIADAALTMVIPILHKISKSDMTPTAAMTPLNERNIEAIDEELAILKDRIQTLERLRAEITGQS